MAPWLCFTTIPGLQFITREELLEVFPTLDASDLQVTKGRILFPQEKIRDQMQKLWKLKSVHHIYWLMIYEPGMLAQKPPEEQLDLLNAPLDNRKADIDFALRQLAELYPDKKDFYLWTEGQSMEQQPTFGVTCNRADTRSPRQHKFTSMKASTALGGQLHDLYKWRVFLDDPLIEFYMDITNDDFWLGIRLTKKSLHDRDIISYGPTSLMPTTAYAMCRLAEIQPGDIVVDPMAGGCSIPVAGYYSFPHAFYMGGDNYNTAMKRSRDNSDHAKRMKLEESITRKAPASIDVFSWDVTALPLREESVDVFLCDMPFGKKIGSKRLNNKLYPLALLSMTYACRKGTGRAVLLTTEGRIIKQFISHTKTWKMKMSPVAINMGGLYPYLFVLQRTEVDCPPRLLSPEEIKQMKFEKIKEKRARKLAEKQQAGVAAAVEDQEASAPSSPASIYEPSDI